jgi:heme exporter protein B
MLALFLRDVKLGVRAGGGALVGLLFFLAIVAIVPFAVGPNLPLLARIGPAMLWIGALLASLLGLERLFQADRETGALDIFITSDTRHWLPLTVFAKCLAHWTVSALPLIVAVPLFGLLLNMEPLAIAATALTLAVGTPAVTFIGATGAAVAVALPRGGLLVSVLVLPLVIPVLIFGVTAANGAIDANMPFLAPLLILTALTLFFAVIGPFAAAAALRAMTD